MIAIDTNVLVRLIAGDDPDQSATVEALLATEALFVSLTVLMETEWVLRSAYGYSRERRAIAFAALLLLDHVNVEETVGVEWALRRMSAGADLADMLHLVANRAASSFATFDRGLCDDVGDNAPLTVRLLS